MWFKKEIKVVTEFKLVFIPGREFEYTVEKNKYKRSRLSKEFLEPLELGKRVVYEADISTGKISVSHQMRTSEMRIKEIAAESYWYGDITPDMGMNMQNTLREAIQQYLNTYYTAWNNAVQLWPKNGKN